MNKILNHTGYDNLAAAVVTPTSNLPRWNKFVAVMDHNNTYCPEPIRVIYNVGTKAYPILENGKHKKDSNNKLVYGNPVKILTTVVYFDDGTKVTVNNSEHDGVKFLETHAIPDDPNSPLVTIADDASKETGFAFATLKRLIGAPDKTGKIDGDGFGRKLRDIVADSFDAVKNNAATKYKKELAKKAYLEKQATIKPKKPRYSIHGTLERINQLLDQANGTKPEGILAKIAAALKA